MTDDKRLIEDYPPIEAISEEASPANPVRKGHISTLHLWWARRPLVYPQKFGKPDPNVRGMNGPKNSKGETTWGGLAEEVRYWGNWVLEKVRAEIADLYPPIPDPEYSAASEHKERKENGGSLRSLRSIAANVCPCIILTTRRVANRNGDGARICGVCGRGCGVLLSRPEALRS